MTVVALDGPAGAGKSTVARLVARELGWQYLDTGAMYRAVALEALRAGVPLDDGLRLGRLAAGAEITPSPDSIQVRGEDVSDRIREADVTAAVSQVAAHEEVRQVLRDLQRVLASSGDVVMEGRDIATAVAPDAEVKIFMTADLEERARRRWGQAGGEYEVLREQIAARDEEDSTREASPLAKAPGALELDTTDLSLEEVVAKIVAAVREVTG